MGCHQGLRFIIPIAPPKCHIYHKFVGHSGGVLAIETPLGIIHKEKGRKVCWTLSTVYPWMRMLNRPNSP